jgi:hypothetical protein
MSFYTTLAFYRPSAPPQITATDLAGFVASFAALGVADDRKGARFGFEVRFGTSIDQDDKPTDWHEPVLETPSGGGIYATRTIAYDAQNAELRSLSDLGGALSALGRRKIYRANLSLGPVVRPVYEGLRREATAENEVSLSLDSWSLEVGPILSYDLATEEPYHVGWVAVQVGGYGYLYPWTFYDLITRAEAISPLQALTDLCRRTWPVAPGPPPRKVVKVRKAMGDLWPYPRADQPWEWSWGLQETG